MALDHKLAAEQQTLAHSLGTLLRRAPVTCGQAAPVREAVRLMREAGVGSVVVVDGESRPVGIFTERDLLRVCDADGLGRPAAEAMTRDPISLPPHALAYEAALAMISRRVRHVLVTGEGKLLGVVSERDLFSLQRLGLAELTMEIRLAGDVALLARLAVEIRRLAALLVEQGAAAEPLTLFVSVLNDRLTGRVIEVVRKRHALERIGWCWLAFGSEGRLEQTFATDQDNGIIFESHDGAPAAETRKRLLPFALEVNQALDACGFPLCKGNVMASNPELCLSLEEWQQKVGRWLATPEPQALLDAAICFDFRPLWGVASLAQALREWVHARARGRPLFLRLMAENALSAKPPLGVLSDFVTDDGPNAPGTIDLKLHGARPVIDAARVYALALGLTPTSTAERLRAAAPGLGMEAAEAAAILAAFFFLQRLRLQKQAPGGTDAPNRIDPAGLHEFDRHILREAFRQCRKLQQRLALDYAR